MDQYICQIVWFAWPFVEHNKVGPDIIQIFKLDLQDGNIVGNGEWEVHPGSSEAEPIFTLGNAPDTFTNPDMPMLHIYRPDIYNSLNGCVNSTIRKIFSGKF